MAFTISLGTKAPDFNLPSTDGSNYEMSDFNEDILVVFFTCNHCPYVIGSDEALRDMINRLNTDRIKFIGINSNSKNTYEEDSFVNMVIRMEENKFPWLYLYDESQEIALKYGALRTPHYFVFNKERELIYTGRAFDNPKNTYLAKTNELEVILNEQLEGKVLSFDITNPIGCNVKWEGKHKHWMPEDACDLI